MEVFFVHKRGEGGVFSMGITMGPYSTAREAIECAESECRPGCYQVFRAVPIHEVTIGTPPVLSRAL